jgi:hypothetical protein
LTGAFIDFLPCGIFKQLTESVQKQVFPAMATFPGAIGNIHIRLVNSS